MKKKIVLVLLSFVMVAMVFAGCALVGGPSSSDAVFGNGGLAVQKGEWLYFASGYESYTNLETSHKNRTGQVEVGALYRTKLNSDGTVQMDEDGYPTNYQRVISKLVGFEYGSIYIFDDQLYFASPNTAKDKLGNHHFNQITFFKANLNGTGLKELYTTKNFASTGKFAINKIDGNVVITVLDGSNLVKINSNGAASVLAETITDAQMVVQKDYSEESAVPLLKNYVFITRARTVAEASEIGVTGNIFEKINISTGERDILKSDANSTYALQGITYSRVFYSVTNTLSQGYIYSSAFNGVSSESQHTVLSNITNFVALQDAANGSLSGFVYTKNAKVYYQTFNDMYTAVEILSSSQTVLRAANGKVYYKNTSGGLSVVDIATQQITEVIASFGTIKLDNAKQIDFIGHNIYIFSKPENAVNNYLYAYSLVASDAVVQLLVKPIKADLVS